MSTEVGALEQHFDLTFDIFVSGMVSLFLKMLLLKWENLPLEMCKDSKQPAQLQ